MDRMREGESQKIRLGVSACLLGQEVRYDGGHKRDHFLTDTLGPFIEWVPVCPCAGSAARTWPIRSISRHIPKS